MVCSNHISDSDPVALAHFLYDNGHPPYFLAKAGRIMRFEVLGPGASGGVVSIAPGFGRPRPNRRGEARGVVVYRADERTLQVDTHMWVGSAWELTAVRTFPRGGSLNSP